MQFIQRNAKYIFPTATGVVLLVLALVLLNQGNKPINIYIAGQEKPLVIEPRSNIPQEILRQAGISIQEKDRVLVDGIRVAADQPIEDMGKKTIQVIKAKKINLTMDGQVIEFNSSAATLGQALWEENIFLRVADDISMPLSTPLKEELKVAIRRSQPVHIRLASGEVNLPTAAVTVGEALAQTGISLQNLDYCLPGENEPLPADRIIQVVRVSEEIGMQPSTIPFTTEYVADGQLDLDTKKLIQAGEYGLRITRVRIRYEDGHETERKTEAEYVAKPPVTQKYAYGTKANIQTLSTPNGVIEYYRAINAWITSYHETGSRTASGTWPVYGDVAVRPEWYKALKGSRVYIPGYGIGTISDVCPGCVGKYWIDVFIPQSAYVSWHKTETIYFLTPIPANPLWILP